MAYTAHPYVFYGGNTDLVAWAFAFWGLVVTVNRLATAQQVSLLGVGLLSAAIWSKQATFVVPLTVFVWALFAGLYTRAGRAAFVKLAALFTGTNLVLLGAVNLLTDGWQFFYNFTVPERHTRSNHLQIALERYQDRLSVPIVLLVALSILALSERVLGANRRDRTLAKANHKIDRFKFRLRASKVANRFASSPAQTGLILFLFLGSLASLYTFSKAGSVDNHFVGVGWGIGLLSGCVISVASRSTLRFNLTLSALFLLLLLPRSDFVVTALRQQEIATPPRTTVKQWVTIPKQLKSLADQSSVYHFVLPDLDIGSPAEPKPSSIAIIDLLAAGYQPKWFIQQILDRKIDFITLFHRDTNFDLYTSGYGRFEENYLWKINALIKSRYEIGSEQYLKDAGLFARRSGPERNRWQRHCFGPFKLARSEFVIRKGGGFWCLPESASKTVVLRATPTPWSELRASKPIDRLSGILKIHQNYDSGTKILIKDDSFGKIEIYHRSFQDGKKTTAVLSQNDRILGQKSFVSQTVGAKIKTHLLLTLESSRSADTMPQIAKYDGQLKIILPRLNSATLSRFASKRSAARFDMSELTAKPSS